MFFKSNGKGNFCSHFKRYNVNIIDIAVFVALGFLLGLIWVNWYIKSSLDYNRTAANELETLHGELKIFNSSFNLSQDDPRILQYIRKYHLYSPPTPNTKKPFESSLRIRSDLPVFSKELKELLKQDEGFFIECGANDGEFLSNTLPLEIRGWTGLLIEGSPSLFSKLLTKRRNAWLSSTCLSGRHPEKLEFLKHKAKFPEWRVGNGKIDPKDKYGKPGHKMATYPEKFDRKDYASEGMVDCVPLYSILATIGVTHVDFFSLDIEGHEYNVLEAIPFDKVHIEVMLVEHFLAPEGKDAIRNLIVSKGYSVFSENSNDFIFKKN